MHSSIIAVVLCLCLSLTYALPSCGINEVFEPKSCGNPCTQRHCANVPSRPCPMYCMSNGGCECKPGFVRNAKNQCTEERTCAEEKVEEVLIAQPTCGVNEVFVATSCGNRCMQRHCPGLPQKPCPLSCTHGGCECQPGFVRNAKDECTEERSCAAEKVEVLLAQPTCGNNEIFVATSCGNRCMQRHCPGLPQKPCPLSCTHGGCECQPGFVRNANDECTEERSCAAEKVEVLVAQPTCGVNEVFVATSCGNRCMQRHCPGLPQKPCPLSCTHGGCECQPGFVRNANDECTEERSCAAEKVEVLIAQPTCGVNEVFVATSCGNRCMQRHCPGLPQKPCPLYCTHGGCECQPGFVRNANDECTEERSCAAVKVELAQPTCGNNEVFVPTSCGNRCMQRHCNGVPQKPCPLYCMHGGCECKPGFIRNANDECNDEKSC